MGMLRVVAAGALVACGALAANIVLGDARRGEQLFKSEQCVLCHSFKGVGGTAAPDLSTHIDRDYTPAVMASLMWNHAPDMWAGMKKRGIVKAELSPESAADSVESSALTMPRFFIADHISGAWFHMRLAMAAGVKSRSMRVARSGAVTPPTPLKLWH